MKKYYLFFSLLVVGFSTQSIMAAEDYRNDYGDAFIFEEGGVEFAVYPDGQFDFYYNEHRNGYNVNVVTPHINFSYNSGYDYDPYVQYDDFGAVIQIEDVPIYYDYYGRIIQAGRVQMSYNHFGMLASVGHLYLHYNHHNHFTHYTGYINARNPYYVYRPWHSHYVRPRTQFAVVFHQPYRAHYHPNRMNYGHYKNYYKKHHHKDFRRSYYRPGDRVTSYHRGRRTASQRDLRTYRSYDDKPVATRSNKNTHRDRNVRQHTQNRNVRNVTGPNARNTDLQRRKERVSNNREQTQRRRESVSTDRPRTQRRSSVGQNRDQNRQVQRREAPARPSANRPERQTRRNSSARKEVSKESTQARRPRRSKTTKKEVRATKADVSTSGNSRSSRGRGN